MGVKSVIIGDFPSGPVAKTSCFQCQGLGSIPGQGTRSQMPQLKILNATTKTWQSQRVTIGGEGGTAKARVLWQEGAWLFKNEKDGLECWKPDIVVELVN